LANNLMMYAHGGDYSSLYNSGFTMVILNSFHFQTDGSIYFNHTEVVTGSGQPAAGMSGLQSTISGLLQNGIKSVLCSIGGGGSFKPNCHGINGWHSVSDNDFKNFASTFWSAVGMTSGLGDDIPVLGALQALLTNSGATGIDLDPEPMFYTYESMASAVAILTEWAAQQNVTSRGRRSPRSRHGSRTSVCSVAAPATRCRRGSTCNRPPTGSTRWRAGPRTA
jgi:hypothetical protein